MDGKETTVTQNSVPKLLDQVRGQHEDIFRPPKLRKIYSHILFSQEVTGVCTKIKRMNEKGGRH